MKCVFTERTKILNDIYFNTYGDFNFDDNKSKVRYVLDETYFDKNRLAPKNLELYNTVFSFRALHCDDDKGNIYIKPNFLFKKNKNELRSTFILGIYVPAFLLKPVTLNNYNIFDNDHENVEFRLFNNIISGKDVNQYYLYNEMFYNVQKILIEDGYFYFIEDEFDYIMTEIV